MYALLVCILALYVECMTYLSTRFDVTLCFPQRVKVYRLNDEGKWDDKGTGHVSVEYLEVSFRTQGHV